MMKKFKLYFQNKPKLKDLLKSIFIVLVVLIISLLSAFTFFLGKEVGTKDTRVKFEDEKAKEQKIKEAEALEKGVNLGDDKLKEISSIIENIKAGKQLSKFAELIRGSELEVKLGEIGPYTIFSYDDTSYDSIPEGKRAQLSDKANQAIIDDYLLNHIIFGEVNSNALVNGAEFKASNGKTLKVRRDANGISINGQKIKVRDIKSRNGTIHILDTALPI
jgi:uncharacterized surface protein with fasciclin (FAS1) repeats